MAGGLWVRALRPCHRIPVPTYLVKSDGRPSLFTTYHHNSPLPEYYTRAVIRQRAFEGRNGQADGNQDAFWRRVRGISGAGFSASLAPGSRPAWARSECADAAEARGVLATLPLVAAGLIDFELIPRGAYPEFARLFSSAAS